MQVLLDRELALAVTRGWVRYLYPLDHNIGFKLLNMALALSRLIVNKNRVFYDGGIRNVGQRPLGSAYIRPLQDTHPDVYVARPVWLRGNLD